MALKIPDNRRREVTIVVGMKQAAQGHACRPTERDATFLDADERLLGNAERQGRCGLRQTVLRPNRFQVVAAQPYGISAIQNPSRIFSSAETTMV